MNREFQNEQEALGKDEQAVSKLVAGLKHVEAPANFERRVMAKIADGRPKKRSIFAFPAIAYSVPAFLVILVATFFAFKLRQPAEPAALNIAAANVSSTPAVTTVPAPESTVTALPSPAAPAVAKVDEKPKPRSADRRKGGSLDFPESSDSNKGGSTDYTVHEKKGPMPEGLDPNSAISVKTMLDGAGMSVKFENGWRVVSVAENGPAEKAGIKVGDTIVALDGRSIDSTTSYRGTASFQTMTIRRGGTLVLVKIQPR